MLRSRRSGLILHLIDSFDQLSFLYCVLFLSILYLHFLFYLCFVCVFFFKFWTSFLTLPDWMFVKKTSKASFGLASVFLGDIEGILYWDFARILWANIRFGTLLGRARSEQNRRHLGTKVLIRASSSYRIIYNRTLKKYHGESPWHTKRNSPEIAIRPPKIQRSSENLKASRRSSTVRRCYRIHRSYW